MHKEAAITFDLNALRSQWWYYTVQLQDGTLARGIYPDDMPFLPRIILSKIDLGGSNCLDIGSVEGIIPILMKKGGAAQVLGTDHSNFCLQKMNYLKALHDVDFAMRYTGPLDNMRQLAEEAGGGFDLINLSGVLYHVFSPIHIITAARSMLKNGGLMIVSTNVVIDDRSAMYFNEAGALQSERNTFWYMSAGLLDYTLRFFRLAPIGTYFLSHQGLAPDLNRTGMQTGYASVLCLATPDIVRDPQDLWMRDTPVESWEYGHMPLNKIAAYPPSTISLKKSARFADQVINPSTQTVDLLRTINKNGSFGLISESRHSHVLMAADNE